MVSKGSVAAVAVLAAGVAGGAYLISRKVSGQPLFRLIFQATSLSKNLGQPTTFTVSAVDNSGAPLQGVAITIYEKIGSSTSVLGGGTGTTNSSGVFSDTVTFNQVNSYQFYAVGTFAGQTVTSNTVTLTVLAASFSLSTSAANIGQTVSWSLANDFPGALITIYIKVGSGTPLQISTTTADSSGNASGSFTATSAMIGSDLVYADDGAGNYSTQAALTVNAQSLATVSVSIA